MDTISTYTVKQAVDDGYYASATDLDVAEVCSAHYKYPCYFSLGIVDTIERALVHAGQDRKGIVHDICWMSRRIYRDISDTTRDFSVLIKGEDSYDDTHAMRAICQPFDESGEPCVCFYLPHED